jgi:hypothetical protein
MFSRGVSFIFLAATAPGKVLCMCCGYRVVAFEVSGELSLPGSVPNVTCVLQVHFIVSFTVMGRSRFLRVLCRVRAYREHDARAQ